jgi:heme exporter protein A
MLEASQIECVRGSRRLFRDLSFRLEARQALRVHGENGSGKTSLLRIVAGLSPAESGEITWKGSQIRALGEDFCRELLFIGHANGLKDDLTPVENLRHAQAISGGGTDGTALKDALGEQGLGVVADLPVKLLSQGQKRRVALGRLAFAADKPLWVLDEPFTALDAASVKRVAATIGEHLQRGGMVMFTTHQDVELPGASMRTLELGSSR